MNGELEEDREEDIDYMESVYGQASLETVSQLKMLPRGRSLDSLSTGCMVLSVSHLGPTKSAPHLSSTQEEEANAHQHTLNCHLRFSELRGHIQYEEDDI